MAPGFRGNMWESDPPPNNCKHILAKNDDPFPSNLYIPPPLPALNRLVIEFPSCAETSKLFVHWVRYSNHLKGSSQRPSRPLMFIMSASLCSALQRCTVCFYKGVRIWMGAWVLVWCWGGGGPEPNMVFIKDERRESFYCLRRLFMLSVRVCMCACIHIKEKFTFDPRHFVVTWRLIHAVWLLLHVWCLFTAASIWGFMPYGLTSFHPDSKKGNIKDHLKSYVNLSLCISLCIFTACILKLLKAILHIFNLETESFSFQASISCQNPVMWCLYAVHQPQLSVVI